MNLDYDKIFSDVKEINKKYKQFQNKTLYSEMTHDEFKHEMKKTYQNLHDSLNFIFNRAVSGNLDTTVFSYMIQKAKDVTRNKISKYEASKDVGEKLVDSFVKKQ